MGTLPPSAVPSLRSSGGRLPDWLVLLSATEQFLTHHLGHISAKLQRSGPSWLGTARVPFPYEGRARIAPPAAQPWQQRAAAKLGIKRGLSRAGRTAATDERSGLETQLSWSRGKVVRRPERLTSHDHNDFGPLLS